MREDGGIRCGIVGLCECMMLRREDEQRPSWSLDGGKQLICNRIFRLIILMYTQIRTKNCPLVEGKSGGHCKSGGRKQR
jgi:hypothetical protein